MIPGLSSISRKIVKPSNCTLVFGIPRSRAAFLRACDNPRSDYAKRFLGGWPQYYAQFVLEVELVEPLLGKWGVSVVYEATLADFAHIFSQPFDAVILFSHWQDDAIEFNGGLETIGTVLAVIPLEFAGVLDLCVCHPVSLVSELHVHRPNCIVKYLPTKAAPHYWIYFYRTLFSHLQTQNLSYLTAVEEVACEFLDAAQFPQGAN